MTAAGKKPFELPRHFLPRMWSARLFSGILTTASLLLTFPVVAECPPRYTASVVYGPDCGIFGLGYAYGYGVNSAGVICGSYACPAVNDKAFVSYDGQTLTPIPMPAGTSQSLAIKVTSDGAILGNYRPPGSPTIGFLKVGDKLQILGTLPGGNESEAADVNSSHVAVGSWGNNATGPFPLAFRWQDGIMADLSQQLQGQANAAYGISENGLITGMMGDNFEYPPHYHAYIFDNGKVTDLGLGDFPDCIATEGRAINSKGHVCGYWWKSTDTYPYWDIRGFFYDGSRMIDLGLIDGYARLIPLDMNENDQIIGHAENYPFGGPSFLWQSGKLWLFSEIVMPNPYQAGSPREITDDGLIACNGSVESDTVALRLSPVAAKSGDTNCDYTVNVDDLLGVINSWGACLKGGECNADLNGDDVVNELDLVTVLKNWD